MIPRTYNPRMMVELMPYILPAAYRLLPVPMRSDRASAMLMTIALQESKCMGRRQMRSGPARSLWQFEPNGILGVMAHPASRQHFVSLMRNLRYGGHTTDVEFVHSTIEHNDILACALARLLLWTDSKPLPGRDEPELGWGMYLRTWNPGDPHRETWDSYFHEAWDRVDFLPEAR